MSSRRRLVTLCALALALLQVAAVFAAPVAACCQPAASAAHASEMDCCPPGAHPPGQCPLHRTQVRPGECRMACSHAADPGLVPGLVAVLPPSPVIDAAVAQTTLVVDPPDHFDSRSIELTSPPPKPRS